MKRPRPVAPALWALFAAVLTLATAVNILEHSWLAVAGGTAAGASWALAVRAVRVYGRRRNRWLLAEHRRALAGVRTVVRAGGAS